MVCRGNSGAEIRQVESRKAPLFLKRLAGILLRESSWMCLPRRICGNDCFAQAQVYLSEDEQLEAIKKWWNRYGNVVLTVITGIMLLLLADQWWERHKTNIAQSASTAYEQLLGNVASQDEPSSRISADSIIEKFPGTPYAEMSHLIAARFDVQQGDYPAALSHLNNVVENGKTKAIKQIARVRSAKILLVQKKPADALKILDVVEDKSFQALISNVKGDCYLALNEKAKARAAYQEALKLMPEDSGPRNLLQIKINDLPGANA